MPSIKDLACWEIMLCRDSMSCLARKHPERSCWSIAREMKDYRLEFDICPDCIVYMVKNDNLVMSAQAISEARKVMVKNEFPCALAG